MFAPENIALHAELLKTAEEKVALDPAMMKLLLAGGVGGAAVGLPTYALTHHHDQAEKARASNQSFGAGVASGLAGPRILRGVLNIAQQNGFTDPRAGAL